MASGHERYNWDAKIARWVWSFALIYRSLVRALITSAALAASVLLAGCNGDDISLANNAKANQPVPAKLVADMATKDMDLQSPMLVRLFKQEAELEVWKQDRSGHFALLKTYPICRWSGDLGPKVREGDRQAPEGFYSITPAQMNPQSAYYLSFNTGYPNAFDKALGRTGSQLMVHGDCSSRGCYAMTDEQIAEIYSLGRESFFGGQRAFQLQAYPFRMTPVNMAKHRNNPNMPFWKMIKEGWDHFEVTRQEPKVDFCEKKYVFDAAKAPNAKRDPVFDASAKCPAYVISGRSRRRRAREAAGRSGRDRQADCTRDAGRPQQHRHRRRHEQGVRRQAARWQYRPVGRRRRSGPVAGGSDARARHHSIPRQSAARARDIPGGAVDGLDGAGCSSTRGHDAGGIRGAECAIRRLLQQSRPQGRARRLGHHRELAAVPAKPKVIEAKRQRAAALGSIDAEGRRRGTENAGHETGRRPAAAETIAPGYSGRGARARRERRPGRRFAADRAGEFVREPFLGNSVRLTALLAL